MPFLLLKMTDVEQSANGRPQHCSYCGSHILQRWGRDSRQSVSLGDRKMEVYRYRCKECGRTFRHPLEINDHTAQTQQVRSVAGLAWALGMSCRQVVDSFEKMGFRFSRMAVWREGQQFIEGKDHNTLDGELRKPFVIDRLYVKGASKKLGVVVVLDFGRGHSLLLGTLNEDDPWFVKSWIESHLKGIRVNVMVGNTGQLIKYEDALPDSLPAWLADHGHKHNNSER